MNLSEEHLLKHIDELLATWRTGLGAGLTANTLALILHQPTKRVVKLMEEKDYRAGFCQTVGAVIWTGMKMGGGRGYWGNDGNGRPFTSETFKKRLQEQTEKGQGTFMSGDFTTTWRGQEAQRTLGRLGFADDDVKQKPTDKECWLCDGPYRATKKSNKETK